MPTKQFRASISAMEKRQEDRKAKRAWFRGVVARREKEAIKAIRWLSEHPHEVFRGRGTISGELQLYKLQLNSLRCAVDRALRFEEGSFGEIQKLVADADECLIRLEEELALIVEF